MAAVGRRRDGMAMSSPFVRSRIGERYGAAVVIANLGADRFLARWDCCGAEMEASLNRLKVMRSDETREGRSILCRSCYLQGQRQRRMSGVANGYEGHAPASAWPVPASLRRMAT